MTYPKTTPASMKRMIRAIRQMQKKRGKMYELQVSNSFSYWCSEMIRLGLTHKNLCMEGS